MIEDYKEIDISGTICPLDVIKVNKMMAKINSNDTLKVVSSKPLVTGNILPTEYDLIAFCDYNKYTITQREISHDKLVMYIQKTVSIKQRISSFIPWGELK